MILEVSIHGNGSSKARGSVGVADAEELVPIGLLHVEISVVVRLRLRLDGPVSAGHLAHCSTPFRGPGFLAPIAGGRSHAASSGIVADRTDDHFYQSADNGCRT